MVSKPAPTAQRQPHISELPITFSNWYKHINWLNTFLIAGLPLIGTVSAYWVPLHPYTAIFAFLFYFNTGLAITAGMLPCHAAAMPCAMRMLTGS